MENKLTLIEKSIPTDSYAGKAIKAVKVKTRGIMGSDFNLVDFSIFMLIHDKFASRGIFITDDNKEECYIKIIETGQEKDIEDLEKFINLRDEIKVLDQKKAEHERIITELGKLADYNDEEAVNSIVEEYLRK